jgi:arylsulfatase A-like enzyme
LAFEADIFTLATAMRDLIATISRFWDTSAEWIRARRGAYVPLEILLRWSCLLCLVALAITLAVKVSWSSEPANAEIGAWSKLAVCLMDVAFFFIAVAVFVIAERRWPKLAFATVPLTLLFVAVSALNYFWLTATGDQIALSVILVGLANPASNLSVAVEEVESQTLVRAGLFAGIGAIGWGALTWPLKRRLRSFKLRPIWLTSAIVGGIGLAALVLFLAGGRTKDPKLKAMSKNVQIALVTASLAEISGSAPAGEKQIDQQQIFVERAEKSGLYNVVFLLLESANFARSSFGDLEANRTPFLAEIAPQGLYAANMRAVMPHSTKSLFSIHCGAYPDMRRTIIEHSEIYPRNCLPQVLQRAGYSTGFFQSAHGEFESRPRLVHNMGFEEYFGREVLHAELTTYINGDDWALLHPAIDWAVEKNRQGPFMLTIFTSLQHISYDFPARYAKPVCKGKKKKQCEENRFNEVYEEITDAFARAFVDELKRVGLAENTIVVLTGDHGEAFGEHGLWIHDNVYYDEGLRIPTIIWFEKLIAPGTVVDEPRSLIDLYPTILSLLNIPYDPATVAGVSLTEQQPAGFKRYFRCWYDSYCQGYVQGNNKVVAVPKDDTYFRFDLDADPEELSPFFEEPELADEIDQLEDWMQSHRELAKGKWTPKRLFAIWDCRKTNGRCKLDPHAFTREAAKGLAGDPQLGLRGSYFKNRKLEGEPQTRRDPVIDFYWPKTAPLKGFPTSDFSIRWEGCIRVEKGETRYIAAGSDDGMAIYIDGKLAVDSRGKHHFRWKTAAEPLAPGIRAITIDYDQRGGEAVAALGWAPSRALNEIPQVVPPDRLIPPGSKQVQCVLPPIEEDKPLEKASKRDQLPSK